MIERALLKLPSLMLLATGLLVPQSATASVDTAWVRRYDGPRHGNDWATCIAVDSAGNVYVAGTSAADTGNINLDFLTIKYRPNGDTAWVRRRNVGNNDVPTGMVVDAQGNVYVSGNTNDRQIATLKYDSTGHLEWTKLFGSRAGSGGLTLDPEGNVIICGAELRASYDGVMVKYLPDAETAWVRYYDALGFDDGFNACASDPVGSLYGAGSYVDSVPTGHCLTVRYDSLGNLLWTARYVGSTHGEYLEHVALAEDGGACVAGSSAGNGSGLDYLTIKYSPTGETLWSRRYNGAANRTDEAKAVAVDAQGNAYVTGYASLAAGQQCVTIRYGPTGETAWVAGFERNNERSAGQAVVVDATGCSYVAGGVAAAGEFSDCLTVKYSQTGDTLWARSYNGPGNSGDYCSAIAHGDDGSVCVTGRSYSAGGVSSDIVTIKYIENGAVREHPQPVLRADCAANPNPFRGQVHLSFSAVIATRANVLVFDATGRRVRTFLNVNGARSIAIAWDGRSDTGESVSAGVYTVILKAGQFTARTKVVKSE